MKLKEKGFYKLHREIIKYLNKKKLTLNNRVSQLLNIIDFFLENDETRTEFNITYIENDEKVKGKFGEYFGHNLRLYANRIGNMEDLIKIAAEQRPEILKYWTYRRKKSPKSNNSSN